MLTYNDLKKGTLFVADGELYKVLEYEFLRMQQRKPVAKTKLKNVMTGKVIDRTFHQNETFEEADIAKEPVMHLYNHRGEFWFSAIGNPKGRFSLSTDLVGPAGQFLKENTEVTAIKFRDAIISIEAPIKVELAVTEAPPGIRGNTAQGGTKAATLETGATINVPLFINAGDIVRVNTETGEYVERAVKAAR